MDSERIETTVLIALLIGIALGTMSGYQLAQMPDDPHRIDNVMTGYYRLDPITIEGRVTQ